MRVSFSMLAAPLVESGVGGRGLAGTGGVWATRVVREGGGVLQHGRHVRATLWVIHFLFEGAGLFRSALAASGEVAPSAMHSWRWWDDGGDVPLMSCGGGGVI